MPYEVPPLPYDYAALEPHLDEQTMRLHHDKHHQAMSTRPTAPSRAPSGRASRSRQAVGGGAMSDGGETSWR